MASDTINATNIASDYASNYAYNKTTDAGKQEKSQVVKQPTETEKPQEAKPTQDVQKSQSTSEVKTIYEEQQSAAKREEEKRKQQAEDEQRAEYLQELTKRLNDKVGSFSEHIKFGVNDKTDSVVISIVEQNNTQKIRELSKEDADKLFRRLDYVLGVLFDNKA
jgi:uncharacterized FlaG/YvyC family protein